MPGDRRTASFSTLAAVVPLLFLAAAPAAAADWSGFFLSPFSGAASPSPGLETGPADSGEIQVGYNQDFGMVVLGGELAIMQDAGGSEEAKRLQLRAGVDFGDALGYVTLGNVQADRESESAGGKVIGFGMSYTLNQVLQLSGELLRNGSGMRAPGGVPQGESLALQAAFRF